MEQPVDPREGLHLQSLTLKSSPLPGPERPIGHLAALVARSVRQFVTAQAEPLGLSTQQFWAIVAIAEHACSSQAELAARLQVDEATACRVVRALSDAGLIATARDLDDRRRIRLQLAKGGDELARRLVPVAREVRTVIDSALTLGERAATRSALHKVLTRLSSLIEASAEKDPRAVPSPTVLRPAAPAPARPRARGVHPSISGRGST